MNKEHEIEYFVDDEPQHTKAEELTAYQIMKLAGVDPAAHYLKSVNPPRSYENNPEELVRLHNHERFVTVAKVPTPVS